MTVPSERNGRPPCYSGRFPALLPACAGIALVIVSAVVVLGLHPGDGGRNSTIWQGLAVVVAAVGIIVLGLAPAISRLWAEHLTRVASALGCRFLPNLASTLESLASGQAERVPEEEIADLKAATRALESANAAPGLLRGLAAATADVARESLRLAVAVDATASMSRTQLEELVSARTSALTNANRNLVGSSWQRRQLLDKTVRAAESERAQLAANLHDGPIQRLATLGLLLDRCKLRLDRGDGTTATELVGRARAQLTQEISHLRQMMSELRPPVLDQGGLDSAIQDHLTAWSEATGVDGRLESVPYGALSPDSETVAYRVVQEALANVVKHAKAGLATVSIGPSRDGVLLVVRDDGRGFDASSQPDLVRQGHFGLVVMRERVELASGQFEVRSAPLTGTEVRFWLPTVSATWHPEWGARETTASESGGTGAAGLGSNEDRDGPPSPAVAASRSGKAP